MSEMVESDQPPMNAAMEDILARCGYETEGRVMALRAWIMLGAEYLAREGGRSACLDFLHAERSRIREAEPGRPWPP